MKKESVKFPIWSVLFLILMVVAAVWYMVGKGKSVTIHFKVIPQVEIGGTLYEGSTVMSAKWTRTDGSLLGFALRMDERGEAVVVDLNERGKLVVLPRTTNPDGSLGEIYPDAIRQSFDIKEYRGDLDTFFKKLRALEPGQRASFKYYSNMAEREFWPIMLTMDDFNDPATVKEVTRENFSEVFGADARFHDLILEITDEPVTSGKLVEAIPLLKDRNKDWGLRPASAVGPNGVPQSEWPLAWSLRQDTFYTDRTWADGG